AVQDEYEAIKPGQILKVTYDEVVIPNQSGGLLLKEINYRQRTGFPGQRVFGQPYKKRDPPSPPFTISSYHSQSQVMQDRAFSRTRDSKHYNRLLRNYPLQLIQTINGLLTARMVSKNHTISFFIAFGRYVRRWLSYSHAQFHEVLVPYL